MFQSKPIFCTSSYGVHAAGQHQQLADLGFNFVCSLEAQGGAQDWDVEIGELHKVGIKSVLRWPNWGNLGLLKDEYGFRASDGTRNPQGSHDNRLSGPSYWCEEAEARALEDLPRMADMGVDGLLLSPLVCDRPLPTDWYPFGEDNQKYTTAFWSWDQWAKKSWDAVSDGYPMPEQAGEILGRTVENMVFYAWYQGAWLGRITRLAQAALDAGIKHVWTWYVPLVTFDAENVADGTAESVPGMEAWRQTIISGGGEPVTVSACLFGLWDRWSVPGVETMRQVNRDLEWTSIVGAEIQGTVDEALHNLEVNGRHAAAARFSGLFCGEGPLLEDPARAACVLSEVRSCW